MTTSGERSVTSMRGPQNGLPRRLKWLVAAALIGRLHSTATNLAVGLTIQAWTKSYTLAGFVIGALALGNGLSAPIRGRSVDRSAPATVATCGAAYMVALLSLGVVTLAAGPGWWPVAVAISLAAGTLLPPVAPAFRSALPRLTRSTTELTRALTWEATFQELIFIVGPPGIVLVAALTNASAALLVVAGVAGLGSWIFSYALSRTRSWRLGTDGCDPQANAEQADAESLSSTSARSRTPLVRLALAYGLLLAALTAMTLVGVTAAVSNGHPAAAGWLEASIAAGSMAGGILASRGLLERWHLDARLAGMTVALGCLVAVTALSAPLVVVALSLAGAGLWIAPSLALHGSAVLSAAPEQRRAEAFGWVNAAGMAINAAVTPIVGLVLDGAGAQGGAALAAASCLVAGVAVTGLRTEPVRPGG